RGRTLVERTGTHVGALSEAAGTLEAVESRLAESLSSRQAVIEAVLSRLEERSQAIPAAEPWSSAPGPMSAHSPRPPAPWRRWRAVWPR
ncbi:hypothetical protein ACLXAR_28510, partial [Escherichia coli]